MAGDDGVGLVGGGVGLQMGWSTDSGLLIQPSIYGLATLAVAGLDPFGVGATR